MNEPSPALPSKRRNRKLEAVPLPVPEGDEHPPTHVPKSAAFWTLHARGRPAKLSRKTGDGFAQDRFPIERFTREFVRHWGPGGYHVRFMGPDGKSRGFGHFAIEDDVQAPAAESPPDPSPPAPAVAQVAPPAPAPAPAPPMLGLEGLGPTLQLMAFLDNQAAARQSQQAQVFASTIQAFGAMMNSGGNQTSLVLAELARQQAETNRLLAEIARRPSGRDEDDDDEDDDDEEVEGGPRSGAASFRRGRDSDGP